MKHARRIALGVLLIVCIGGWLYLIWLEQVYDQQAENYTRIEDGLWMGGSVEKPPPGTRAVLNLCSVVKRIRAEEEVLFQVPAYRSALGSKARLIPGVY